MLNKCSKLPIINSANLKFVKDTIKIKGAYSIFVKSIKICLNKFKR